MSWKLTPHEFPMTPEEYECLQIGDTWKVPLNHKYSDGQTHEEAWLHFISPEFRASGRDYVIFIRLPGHVDWCVDHTSSRSLQTQKPQGWVVEGEWPNLTISPSIDAIGRYHGFVNNGELTDDLEGRSYDQSPA